MGKDVPRVGIMATRLVNRDIMFAERGYFHSLIAAGNSIGVGVYVFSPTDIDWPKRTVVGWRFSDSRKAWMSAEYPLPDVVYDRMFPTGSTYGLMAFREGRKLRRYSNIKWYSSSLSGKWQVYKSLVLDEDIAAYLPETKLCDESEAFMKFLQKHNVIFLKPDMGTQGKGILRISKIASNRYYYKGRDRHTRSSSGIIYGEDGLKRLVRNAIGGRRYLMQQGLALNVFRNSPCDVRVIVQKTADGTWGVTGHAVRVGPAQGITSNLHGGGTAVRLDTVLESLYPDDENKQLEQRAVIEDVSLRIAKLLDVSLGPFAEFGLDIGLDIQGKVWLIEVNSKPGRKVFLHTKDWEARKASILNPIAYCKYLALQESGCEVIEA